MSPPLNTVLRPAELSLIGRLYLECCTSASEAGNGPIEEAIKLRIARSLIRSFDRLRHDPEMMKQAALQAALPSPQPIGRPGSIARSRSLVRRSA
jgi:hypothetical protein